MRTQHLVYGLSMLLLASLASPGYANTLEDQSVFVSELARDALLSVTSETFSAADRQRRLAGFLDKDFDMPPIASFVLGRYWQKATEVERQTFTAVYRDFMVGVYSQRFTKFTGESFRVIGQRTEAPTVTIVSTEMSRPTSGQPIKVEWRVVDSDGYRITDISIAGISMTLAQREDFGSFLQKNGGDLSSLIHQLQMKMTGQEFR